MMVIITVDTVTATQLQQGEEKGAASVVGNRVELTNRIIFILSALTPPSSSRKR